MSTILNALKKLEQESPAEETEHPPALNIHLRQERHLWKQKNARTIGGIPHLPWAVLLALLLLGGFLLFALITGRFQGERPSTKKTPMVTPMQPALEKVKAQPAETGPQKTAQAPVRKPKRPVAVPPARPVEAPLRETVTPAMPKMTGTAKTPEMAKMVSNTERSEMTRGTETAEVPEKPETPPQPLPGREAAVVEKAQARDKEIPLLEDGRLKINAISWSRQADERLAVINSVIVREGQTVEGFRLVRIMEDGVIVQRSGRKSRVEFRLR